MVDRHFAVWKLGLNMLLIEVSSITEVVVDIRALVVVSSCCIVVDGSLDSVVVASVGFGVVDGIGVVDFRVVVVGAAVVVVVVGAAVVVVVVGATVVVVVGAAVVVVVDGLTVVGAGVEGLGLVMAIWLIGFLCWQSISTCLSFW